MDFFSFLEPHFSAKLPKKIYAIFEVLSGVPRSLHCLGNGFATPTIPARLNF